MRRFSWVLAALLGMFPLTAETPAPNLNAPRQYHTTTVLTDGRILVAGGQGYSAQGTFEVFDPATGQWTQGTLQSPRMGHTATLLPGGAVLLAGGAYSDSTGTTQYNNSAELFLPGANATVPTGSMAAERFYHTATVLPTGKVLIAGGNGGIGPTPGCELYDPASGTWSSTGAMATAREWHTATLLPSGKVLVAGGTPQGPALASSELYDPQAGTWVPTGAMNTARLDHVATLLPTGKVLVAGGYSDFVQTSTATAELYDPAAGTWTATTPLGTPRAQPSATLLTNGTVLVAGGYQSGVGALATTEIYDPTAATWTAGPALSTTRQAHTATLLPSGRLLLVGGDPGLPTHATAEEYDPTAPAVGSATAAPFAGRSATLTLLQNGKVLRAGGYNGAAVGSAAIYDPATGNWTSTGSLKAARYFHTATLLPSGKVLVVGGFGTTYLGSAELYDPSTGAWTTTGSLTTARDLHTATLLPSGKVLVAGGEGTGPIGPQAVAAAELYDPATGTWSPAGSMLYPAERHTASLLPGKVLFAGGLVNGGESGLAETYDTSQGTWSALSYQMLNGRYDHTATVLPDGEVLFIGGITSSNPTTYVEVFTSAGRFIQGAPLNTARSQHTATLLASGDVLVTGGTNGTTSLSSAELFDGVTQKWITLPPLATPRNLHDAVLLPNNKVLVVGGYNGNTALSSAELVSIGLGAQASWTPTLTSISSVAAGQSASLTGALLTGISESSSGGFQSSATNGPMFLLEQSDKGSGAAAFVPTGAWSATSATALLPATLPGGVYFGRVVVNGVPSAAQPVTVLPPVAINPAGTQVLASKTQAFTVSGGTGGGYVWSLPTNNSGGSINASTGLYTAGTKEGTSDLVQVVDSGGNKATATVNVPSLYLFPASASPAPQGSVSFSCQGGSGSYSWAISTNNSGATLTSSGSSATYTAGSKAGVTDTVTVTDSLGYSASTPITIPAPYINPATTTVWAKQQQNFYVYRGTGPSYTWTLLTNNSGGSIIAASGSPTTGLYTAGPKAGVTDTLQVTDSLGNTATATVTVPPLVVNPAATPTPPRGTVSFTASGGTGVGYAWSISTNNSGATIDSTGFYKAGTTGNVVDTVMLQDSGGNSVTATVSVGPPITVTPSTASAQPLGTVSFSATGGAGSGFLTWSINPNNSGGTIDRYGTYTAGPKGSVTDTVVASDFWGNSGTATVTLTGASLSPSTATVVPLQSASFNASGCAAGCTCSMKTNASGGSVTGTSSCHYVAGPMGNTTDVIQVQDNYGNNATATITVGPAVTVTPTSATVAPNGSLNMTASGGDGLYQWTFVTNASGGWVGSGSYNAGSTPNVTDVVKVSDDLGDFATVTIQVGAGVTISPNPASVAAQSTLQLGASGGSGTGYTWSFKTNASGGTLDASTGLYASGITAGVTDVVQVADSLGNTATGSIQVLGVSISPNPAYVAPGAKQTFTAQGGTGKGYIWSMQSSPSGGSITPDTGVYTAGPVTDSTDVVYVTDSWGNSATATVHVQVGPPPDAGSPGDAGSAVDGGTSAGGGDGGTGTVVKKSGCGCGSTDASAPFAALLLALGLAVSRGSPSERRGSSPRRPSPRAR